MHMKGLGYRLLRIRWHSPLTIVELIIAISTIVGGVYVLSPLLDISTYLHSASPLVATLGSDIGILLFGLIFLISGILMLVGVIVGNYRLRSIGLFTNFMSRLYVILATFIIQGFLPLTWVSNFTIGVIAIVCYLVVRGMIIKPGGDK